MTGVLRHTVAVCVGVAMGAGALAAAEHTVDPGETIQAEVDAGLLTLDVEPRQPTLAAGRHDRAE